MLTIPHMPLTVEYKHDASAPSIFRASNFEGVTHSLADSDFHGHRPAVLSYQRLSLYPISVDLGALTRRLVHPTAPVLLTKNGPLGTLIRVSRLHEFEQAGDLTHLKFENRLRSFRPQCL
ncbi:hypothetical protein JTB14_023624 [Gonioctena quinquepunctata]|nr:hypothetical protein JTB14_023624 [Gonioctena quinquepunctata]